MKDGLRILERNRLLYEYLLRSRVLEPQDRPGDEELLERIEALARFAWRNHTGYFADGRLENLLLEFCRPSHADEPPTEPCFSVLHVASELGQVGGHTRILFQMLRRSNDPRQAVVVTRQQREKIPDWFIAGIGSIPVITLDSGQTLVERAVALRRLREKSRLVMLYHHPWDSLPVLAFAQHGGGAVLLENHAHSWFWLGSSIADLVVSHSRFHTRFTQDNRPVRAVRHLPFTQLEELVQSVTPEQKQLARQQLAVPADCVCLISIGTAEKFVPNDDYNFYRTARKILARFPQVRLYIIGSEADPRHPVADERIHFLGYVADPITYYLAADICLDAMPQPSLGGTLYAALAGMACPLYKYGAGRVFNGCSFIDARRYQEYLGNPLDEATYLNRLDFLIANPQVRQEITADIRQRYLRRHNGKRLKQQLLHLFSLSGSMQHCPAPLPEGVCHRDVDSAEIAAASELQALPEALQYFDAYLSRLDKLRILALLLIRPAHIASVFQYCISHLAQRMTGLGFWRHSPQITN